MGDFISIMEMLVMFFKRGFVIYGFTLSFWDIFMFCIIFPMLIYFISELFSG